MVPTQQVLPLIVMQLPLDPAQASNLGLTAPLVGFLGSMVGGPGAGPVLALPQGMLGHT